MIKNRSLERVITTNGVEVKKVGVYENEQNKLNAIRALIAAGHDRDDIIVMDASAVDHAISVRTVQDISAPVANKKVKVRNFPGYYQDANKFNAVPSNGVSGESFFSSIRTAFKALVNFFSSDYHKAGSSYYVDENKFNMYGAPAVVSNPVAKVQSNYYLDEAKFNAYQTRTAPVGVYAARESAYAKDPACEDCLPMFEQVKASISENLQETLYTIFVNDIRAGETMILVRY